MLEAPPPVSVAPSVPEAVVPERTGPRAGRFLVLAAVFVCAACGLVYELELVALASSLTGDPVTQASVVLSVMVFAMGVGSLLAKRLRCRAAVGFGLLEAVLALAGGCSALLLYGAFAWLGGTRHALVGVSLLLGVLIGAEMPLLMTLIQRVSRCARQDAGGAVADLFAADYVGALVGGLAFPFLLLPWLGQLTTALATGAVNALAGGALVLWLFHRDLTGGERLLLWSVNAAVLAVLAGAAVLADDFERAARHAVYGAHVRVAVRTHGQEVVLTGPPDGPPDLYVDGRLRVRGGDPRRHHPALVHPAMRGRHARVLVLGGGDGLAVREVLRYADVESVTVVGPDPMVVRLARTDPALARLNGHAFGDRRVRVVPAEPFHWLRTACGGTPYDVVVSDLPPPAGGAGATPYSLEFYGLAARHLAAGGRLAVHAGPLPERPRAYWTVEASLRAAGFTTRPYTVAAPAGGGAASGHAEGAAPATVRAGAGPAAGADAGGGPAAAGGADAGGGYDRGFVLAVPGDPRRTRPPALGVAAGVDGGGVPSAAALEAGARRMERSRPRPLPPSTLTRPRYGP
ncbi:MULTISPECIES: polyamine aminopropyltransferase [Streptomyces]|uniref:polyamine aminopropyltransferase n=1 Tax=Streptomyces TaxID=1883 RepID=UPI00085AA088|nr:polyamine aminopropyltransferase [Streptomyces rubrolavendulae]